MTGENILNDQASLKQQMSAKPMTKVKDMQKLRKNEFYKCPLLHIHPRHEKAFFKNFDVHFRVFRSRKDHFAVVQLHEELAWKARRLANEKGSISEEDLKKISDVAWFEAVKKQTGKSIQVVKK